MASFFRGITQSSPFQQAIEKVTDAAQANEDWDSIMKICDHVSVHDENAKEAVKVIRKRLQTNPATSGWRSIGLSLTLLEALTKNCGKRFHLQIAQKDFLKDFGDVLNPKNSPPAAIQEQVLGLLQTWAVAFRDDPDLKNVEQFYQEFKQRGLEFPPAEPDSIVKAAVPATGTLERQQTYARSMSQPVPGGTVRQTRSASDGSTEQMVLRQITAEQLAKLRSELDVVQTNGQIFGEMLITLQPGEEHPADFQLLMELEKTCQQMQARIIELLSQISIDDLTVDLLRYNDEFNNSFITFESYMKERERRVGPALMPASPVRATASAAAATAATATISHASPTKTALPSLRQQDNEPALIKFDDESRSLSPALHNISINSTSLETVPKPIPQQATSMNIDSASVTTRTVSSYQDSERDVNELEQLLASHDVPKVKEEPIATEKPTEVISQLLENHPATLPEDPISEQQIQIDLDQPASENSSKA